MTDTERRTRRIAAVIGMDLYAVCSIAWLMRYVYGSLWNSSMSVFVCLFAAILFIYERAYQVFAAGRQRRMVCFGAVNAVLFSCMTVFGILIKHRGYVFGGRRDILIVLLVMAGLFLPFMALGCIFLSHISGRQECYDAQRKTEMGEFSVKRYLAVAGLIFTAWIPILAAYYPGIFAYDVTRQLEQVIGNRYTVFHPLIHTGLLGVCFTIGGFLGSYTSGMLLYSLLQMAVMALCFAYGVMYVSGNGRRRAAMVLATLFFALFPVHPVMAVSTIKDSLFSALVLVFVVETARLSENMDLLGNRKWLFRFLTVGTLMMLFRNNAVYAFLCCIPFWILILKERRKQVAKFCLILLAVYFLFSKALAVMLQAERGNILEMLSVPIQQIARVGIYDGERMDTELRDEIRYFIPDETLERYAEAISDGIKNSMEEEKVRKEPVRFAKLYGKLLVRFPGRYLDAFLKLTLGDWYPDDVSNAEIYGMGLESRLGYMLTNHKQMPEGYGVDDRCYLPAVRKVYEILFSANYYQKLPVIAVLFAPSLYWWAVYLSVFVNLYRKNYRRIVPALFLVGYYGTVLLGPVCLIRYMYPFVVCLPLFARKTAQE